MRDCCDAHGIPRPEVNAIIAGEEVDFLWRARRLVVETDGHETDGTRAAFERDRAKDARLTMRGYRVVLHVPPARLRNRRRHRHPGVALGAR